MPERNTLLGLSGIFTGGGASTASAKVKSGQSPSPRSVPSPLHPRVLAPPSFDFLAIQLDLHLHLSSPHRFSNPSATPSSRSALTAFFGHNLCDNFRATTTVTIAYLQPLIDEHRSDSSDVTPVAALQRRPHTSIFTPQQRWHHHPNPGKGQAPLQQRLLPRPPLLLPRRQPPRHRPQQHHPYLSARPR